MSNTPRRQYSGSPLDWENKLRRVMARFGIEEWNWNRDRYGAWITFHYKGQLYRFEQTVARAQANGQKKIVEGTDCFAQLVLSLEGLARMVERGIYDLGTWIAGMKALPEAETLPECLQILGFDRWPATVEAVQARYRQLAKTAHPDQGGDAEWFRRVREAKQQAEELVKGETHGR